MAEIDALGRTFGQIGLALGAAAAFDHRDLRAETEEPDVVKFSVDGIETGQTTFGHRFMAPAAISVRRFEDYEAKLKAAKVVLDLQRGRTSSPTPSSWRSRRALSWSRTRCCWTRSPASSNGRSR